MFLEAKDLRAIHKLLGNGIAIPWQSFSLFEILPAHRYQPKAVRIAFEQKISDLKKQQESLGDWSDVRVEGELKEAENLLKILLGPIDYAPLFLNTEYEFIAKWRLENAK